MELAFHAALGLLTGQQGVVHNPDDLKGIFRLCPSVQVGHTKNREGGRPWRVTLEILCLLDYPMFCILWPGPSLRQPVHRLPFSYSSWDSCGKNTGVVYHFLLQCTKVKSESEVAQSCPTLSNHGPQPTRLFHPWDFPGKSPGVGCHRLLCLF